MTCSISVPTPSVTTHSSDSLPTSIDHKFAFTDSPTPELQNCSNLSVLNPSTLVQPATGPTLHSNSGDIATLDNHPATLNQLPSVNTERCLKIIHALRIQLLDTKNFNDVSPEDYRYIVTLLSQRKRNRVCVKLVYYSDLWRLVAMSPYEINQTPFQHIAQRIQRLLMRLSVDDEDVTCGNHLNRRIDWDGIVIPDFHLDLRPSRSFGASSIPLWVGESGFCSTEKMMERQLKLATSAYPEIDVAMMFSICQVRHPTPPKSHPLWSLPALPRAAFIPTVTVMDNSLPPVVAEGITWLEVKSVTLRVFLRKSDGEFDFKGTGPFCAQGSLFHEINMDAVNDILDKAVQRLTLRIVEMMEADSADPVKIARLRTECKSVSFPSNWPLLFCYLQHSLYDTAYSRYHRWREQPKRKADDLPSQPGPSSERSTPSEHSQSQITKNRVRSRKRRSCK